MILLSTAGKILAAISVAPDDVRLRDLAARLDITERTVWTAIEDLIAAGIIERDKVGRRNIYRIHHDLVIGDRPDATVAAFIHAVT